MYLMNTVVPGNLPAKDSAQTAVAFRVQLSEQDDFSTKKMNWENIISRQDESAIVILFLTTGNISLTQTIRWTDE